MMRMGFGLVLVCAMALPAMASEKRKKSCAATRDIVATAVEGRKGGLKPGTIKARLLTGDAAVGETYQPTVEPLVDWVFGLDKSMLTDATVAQYETQCLNY